MGGFFKTPFFLRIPCGHRVRFSPVRFRFLKYGRSRKLNVSARMGRSASLQPRPISLSWITGVHKVLYYVSNFYAKNSSLHQPCSHGHWVRFTHTACPSAISPLEIRTFARSVVLAHMGTGFASLTRRARPISLFSR